MIRGSVVSNASMTSMTPIPDSYSKIQVPRIINENENENEKDTVNKNIGNRHIARSGHTTGDSTGHNGRGTTGRGTDGIPQLNNDKRNENEFKSQSDDFMHDIPLTPDLPEQGGSDRNNLTKSRKAQHFFPSKHRNSLREKDLDDINIESLIECSSMPTHATLSNHISHISTVSHVGSLARYYADKMNVGLSIQHENLNGNGDGDSSILGVNNDKNDIWKIVHSRRNSELSDVSQLSHMSRLSDSNSPTIRFPHTSPKLSRVNSLNTVITYNTVESHTTNTNTNNNNNNNIPNKLFAPSRSHSRANSISTSTTMTLNLMGKGGKNETNGKVVVEKQRHMSRMEEIMIFNGVLPLIRQGKIKQALKYCNKYEKHICYFFSIFSVSFVWLCLFLVVGCWLLIVNCLFGYFVCVIYM